MFKVKRSMPSNTTSRIFFQYVYVLESLKDGKRYIGYTGNLKKRLEEHNKGKIFLHHLDYRFGLFISKVVLINKMPNGENLI